MDESAGDTLVTGGGDVFTSDAIKAADMLYLAGLSSGTITQPVWDVARRVVFTLEGSVLHYYNLTTRVEFGTQALSGAGGFLGIHGDRVYVTIPTETATQLVSWAHPAPGGATNMPPTARFSIGPQSGGTTQTDLTFDASPSTDPQDAPASLVFRWDLDNDGIWDGPFQSAPTVTRRYIVAGSKTVRLQVRDSLGLTGEFHQTFDVAFTGSGAVGPSHTPFSTPIQGDRCGVRSVRPYLYMSDKTSRSLP
jgi:hypothetical protein